MTRAYLEEPMREIGEDFDQSLVDIHVMLDAVAASLAERYAVEAYDTKVMSCDNGGIIYSLSVCNERGGWRVEVPLNDDVTLQILHSNAAAFCDHVERRIEQAAMPEDGGHG